MGEVEFTPILRAQFITHFQNVNSERAIASLIKRSKTTLHHAIVMYRVLLNLRPSRKIFPRCLAVFS